MNAREIGIGLLSVSVSICSSLWLSRYWTRRPADTVQAKRIEIIDEDRRVRGTIGLARIGTHKVPEFVLLDERGRISVLLALNERGEGTVFFSSKDREGKVGIGYLSGTDSTDGSAITEDSLGSWGVRVHGPGLQITGLAFGNSGQLFLPAH